jgi:hypothetical protein
MKQRGDPGLFLLSCLITPSLQVLTDKINNHISREKSTTDIEEGLFVLRSFNGAFNCIYYLATNEEY